VIALRIFHGLGFSIFILAGLLIAVLLVREEQRAYAIGVVSTGFMIPLLIVPAMGEEIIQRFGFPCFFLSAILLSAIPVVYALFAPIQLPHEEDEEELVGAGFFKLLSQRKIFFIFLLTFVFEIGLSSSLTFVPLLAHQESAMRAGYFYSFLGMTAVFMRLFGGRWLKFWGSPKVLLPAFYFLCGGSALVFLARTSWMLGLSGIVWGIGVGFLYPHLSALSVERVSNREKGKVLSLFASSVDLGFALGPLFFGWLSQAIGIRLAFLPLALIIFLSSSLLIWVGRSALVITKSGETSPFCPDE
jgi:predicted MFS family arabinose efflux permease